LNGKTTCVHRPNLFSSFDVLEPLEQKAQNHDSKPLDQGRNHDSVFPVEIATVQMSTIQSAWVTLLEYPLAIKVRVQSQLQLRQR
jgi:hypothetical protein